LRGATTQEEGDKEYMIQRKMKPKIHVSFLATIKERSVRLVRWRVKKKKNNSRTGCPNSITKT